MDHAKVEKAIFLGHDWGGWFVWRMCLWFPERVLAVGAVVTSYVRLNYSYRGIFKSYLTQNLNRQLPPSKYYLSSAKVAEKLPIMKYQQYFDEGGDGAVRELESNVELTIAAIVRMPNDRPGIGSFWMRDGTLFGSNQRLNLPKSASLSQGEYDLYVETFKKSGFAGCINYYRTRLMNFEDEKVFLSSPEKSMILHPALIITAAKDVILSPHLSIGMEKVIPNLTRHNVDAGHWAHVEKKDEVNQMLLNWLQKVVSSSKL
jgi:soluble epoxide hydrolase / lipid-phosphate phosphatase